MCAEVKVVCQCGKTFADAELLALHRQARHTGREERELKAGSGFSEHGKFPAPSAVRRKQHWLTTKEMNSLADSYRPKE